MTGLLITEPLSRAAMRCLTDVAMNVVQHSPFDWQFELPAPGSADGSSLVEAAAAEAHLWPGTACVEGDWLRVEVTCGPPGTAPTDTALAGELRLNARFGPGVRLARDRQRQRVLQAELTALPHFAQHNMGDCVDRLLQDLVAALSQQVCTLPDTMDGIAAEFEGEGSEPQADETWESASPLDLARAAGWEASPRESGRAAVTLDVPGAFHQVEINRLAGGGLRLVVPVVEIPREQSPACTAVAALLQTTACPLRLPRAVIHDAGSAGEETLQFGWEVLLPEETDSDLLHQAFAALSVAMRHTAGEASALQSEELSRRYLAVRGWSP